MPILIEYVKTFKVVTRENKLMSFRIGDEKLLENCKAIWTKIEDFKNIKLNGLPAYDHIYLKIKTRIYGDKVYNNFVVQICQKVK